MVRFQWHTDDGSLGQVLPGNFTKDAISDVFYATAEIRVPGQRAAVEANFTLPKKFLEDTKSFGIALSIGERAAQWNLKFLIEVGTSLAKQGYVVIRFLVKFDEQRKQSEIEKTIGACMASPYAQHVKKWVVIGVGTNSHISCGISHLFKDTLSSMILVACPLTMKQLADPETVLKSFEIRDEIPLLFLHPSVAEACKADELLRRLKRDAAKNIKYMNIPDVDQNFRSPKGKTAAHLVSSFVVSAVLEFLNLLERDQLDNSMMPSLERLLKRQALPPSDPKPEENNNKKDEDEPTTKPDA